MKTFEKVLTTIVAVLLVALIAFLTFIIYDVSTTTCLEHGTVKRILSVDGNSNRALVELTDGSTKKLAFGHITEYQIVCKKYGKNHERTN